MAAPMLYRPGSRWQVCAAFCGAILIHAGAVALAARSATPPPLPLVYPDLEIEIIEVSDPSPPQQLDPPPDILTPPPPVSDSTFVDDTPTPPPVRHRIDPPQRLVKASPAAPRVSMGSAKVLAISAPRPEYPYEARRQRATGSGVAVLTVDAGSGYVTEVRMLRSTGNAVLDNAATSGFRRWRFRPGTVSIVQAPITYTLTGAAF